MPLQLERGHVGLASGQLVHRQRPRRQRQLASLEHRTTGSDAGRRGTGSTPALCAETAIGDDFHGEKRGNGTHASTTDPDAQLSRKGKEAKLSYLANALMENRNGLLVAVDVRHASGTGARDGALDLLTAAGVKPGATLGADKGYVRNASHLPTFATETDHGRQPNCPLSKRSCLFPASNGTNIASETGDARRQH